MFGASSNYDAHATMGAVLHVLPLILLVAAVATPSMRNRVDIGLAVLLLVLVTVQAAIGDFETLEAGASHPVNALLIVGLSWMLFKRDRALLTGSE